MLTPPSDLADTVVGELLSRWGLEASTVEHAALGFGSHHWVAETTAGRWFVTGDRVGTAGAGLERALAVARALADRGHDHVVAPLRSRAGAVLERHGPWAVAVYPWLAGETLPDPMSPTHAHEALRLVAAVHGDTEAVRDLAPVDDLALPSRASLESALQDLSRPWSGGPYAEPVRELLAPHVGLLLDRLAAYDALVALLGDSRDTWVLTHGEPHARNLIRTSAGLRLIDWDTAMLAPPGRDLFHLDPTGGEMAQAYAELTGRPVRQDELGFHRLRWALGEVADFTGWLRADHTDDADTRIAWASLQEELAVVVDWT